MLGNIRDLIRDDAEGPAISVQDLTTTFRIYTEKPGGLKERLYRFSRPAWTDFNALSEVTFDVAAGEAVGVVGHNGSGKSTLLKVLARILPPDAGDVQIRGRVASLLELGAGFHGDLSGRENIYLNGAILGLTRAEITERFDEIVEFSGVGPFLDTAVRNYSSGMYVRLGFAIAMTVDPDVLLVDEVLSVGDAAFQERSLTAMRELRDAGRTLLVVSHDLDAIASLCSRVLVLHRGKVRFDGSVGEGLALYRQLTSSAPREPAVDEDVHEHGVVELLDASLTDRNGEEVEAVDPGTALLVRLRLRAAHDVAACSVGVRVHRGDGIEVYATHAAWRGVGVGPLRAEQEAVVELRLTAHLLAGHYRIAPVVTDPRVRFDWSHGEVLDLEVAPTRGATGLVDLGAAYAVTDGPALRLGSDAPPRGGEATGGG